MNYTIEPSIVCDEQAPKYAGKLTVVDLHMSFSLTCNYQANGTYLYRGSVNMLDPRTGYLMQEGNGHSYKDAITASFSISAADLIGSTIEAAVTTLVLEKALTLYTEHKLSVQVALGEALYPDRSILTALLSAFLSTYLEDEHYSKERKALITNKLNGLASMFETLKLKDLKNRKLKKFSDEHPEVLNNESAKILYEFLSYVATVSGKTISSLPSLRDFITNTKHSYTDAEKQINSAKPPYIPRSSEEHMEQDAVKHLIPFVDPFESADEGSPAFADNSEEAADSPVTSAANDSAASEVESISGNPDTSAALAEPDGTECSIAATIVRTAEVSMGSDASDYTEAAAYTDGPDELETVSTPDASDKPKKNKKPKIPAKLQHYLDNQRWCGLMMAKESGLSVSALIALKFSAIEYDPKDPRFVRIKHRNYKNSGSTHIYDFQILPLGAEYLNLYISWLKKNYGRERIGDDRYLLSADEAGTVPLKSSDLTSFFRLTISRYRFGYASKNDMEELKSYPGIRILQATYEHHLEYDCGLLNDSGAIAYERHYSLSNSVQADNYRCFSDETGTAFFRNSLMRDRRTLGALKPAKRANLYSISEEDNTITVKGKHTDYGITSQLDIPTANMTPGDTITIKFPYGGTVNMD